MTRGKRAGAGLAIALMAASGTGMALAATTSPRASEVVEPAQRTDARHAALLSAPDRARERRLSRRGVFPVRGPVDYGEGGARYGSDRGGRMHEGQDLFAPAGTPLAAVRDGVVLETGSDGGRGNYVALFNEQAGETYLYLHMQEPATVSPGARVRAGRRVGSVGCSGSCFGDHLHFEARDGRGAEAPPKSPLPLLRRLAR